MQDVTACLVGVDPGTANLGLAQVAVTPSGPFVQGWVESRARGETLLDFLLRIEPSLREVFGSSQGVVVERQFARGNKDPERVEHALEFLAASCGKPVMVYTPTQLRKFVTSRGDAAESVFWRKVEQGVAEGRWVVPAAEHAAEAALYCWAAICWLRGENAPEPTFLRGGKDELLLLGWDGSAETGA